MRGRLRLVGLGFLLGFLALLFRLAYWQLVRGAELQARARAQHFDSLTFPGTRGEIFSQDQAVLAGSVSRYLLFVYKPDLEGDRGDLSERLAGLLYEEPEGLVPFDEALEGQALQGLASEDAEVEAVREELREEAIEEKRQELQDRLERDSVWEPLDRGLDQATKEEVEQLGVAGLGFQLLSSRYYPEASMSAQVLGFVGSDSAGRPKGYFGLEGFYDRELRGKMGVLRQEKDAVGNPILVGSFNEVDSTPGRSVVTNLDRFVQSLVEEELKLALERYGAVAGEVVVMDPKTGAVLASASFPNYDPGKFKEYESQYHRNPVISDSYEPGSTFKVLVMAAALEEGVVEPETKCDACDGPVKIGKYQIRTWDGQYRPEISMTETIVHSDNTGMVFAGLKLGERKLVQYLKKFGIGRLTGIDLQEEVSPTLREKWGDIDVATASFGQGVAVTTIQMLAAVGVIANEGVLMVPQVGDTLIGEGEELKIAPERVGRVVSRQTAEAMTEMMVKAVIEGEAKFAAPDGYRIAGKTGTAQIPVAGHYDTEKTIVSFVGFAPADEPRFVMITKLKEPESSPWGSETAAPLWFSIAEKLLRYWGITPSSDIIGAQ